MFELRLYIEKLLEVFKAILLYILNNFLVLNYFFSMIFKWLYLSTNGIHIAFIKLSTTLHELRAGKIIKIE